MSIEIARTTSTDRLGEKGFKITRLLPEFTDWNDRNPDQGKTDSGQEKIPVDTYTMRIGNRTDLDLDSDDVSQPTNSVVICKKNFYERLDSHNRDTWWEYRADAETWRNLDNPFKQHVIDAFGLQLGMNSYQKQQAFTWLMKLDLPRMGVNSELIAFVICAIVTNKSAESYGDDNIYHPQRAPRNNDPHFQQLEDVLIRRFSRITKSAITSVYNKLTNGDPPTRPPSDWRIFVNDVPFISKVSNKPRSNLLNSEIPIKHLPTAPPI